MSKVEKPKIIESKPLLDFGAGFQYAFKTDKALSTLKFNEVKFI